MKKQSLKNLTLNKKTISRIHDTKNIVGGRVAFETFVEYSCHPETCNTQVEKQ